MKNLLLELEALAQSDRYPFHMPGHKRNLAGIMQETVGQGPEMTGAMTTVAGESQDTAVVPVPWSPQEILTQASRLDITEIDDFDNLHAPEGILKEALQRAAALYGADETFYSVNGSTAGILTAISAAAPEGSRVLVARNCHKAVYHALYLRRLKPIYLYPGVIGDFSIADAIKDEAVEEALCRNPDVKAVILTSPTYDVICADVKEIADVVHAHGAVLIVDAAHGAHFGFHPGFPESPVRLGADLTVVSLHKTLPAMTQTALLHVKGDRVDRRRLRMFSGMYQTSSPSYFFMAGMDTCMRMIEDRGSDLWEEFWRDREIFLEKTKQLENLRVFTAGRIRQDILMDAGKILIETGKTGLTGQQLYDILLEKYHLQLEMAAGDYATAIVTCCDRREGWERLAEALIQIDHACGRDSAVEDTRKEQSQAGQRQNPAPYPQLKTGLSLPEALDRETEMCPISEAEGKIAGGFVNLYPPGIPLAVPGEILSAEVIRLICRYAGENLPLQGVTEGCIPVIR